MLRLIRLGEAGVERRGFDLYVKARKDEGQTGESAFGYRRGKEKSLGEGKASIAGFCESAFTRGAGAHLDVGGGLLLDLGNGLFDLNLKIGRGTGRLGRPSRASFLLVPACTANETGKNEIDTWRRRHRTAERTSWTGSASASSHREVVAPMVKRTCACSLESDARGAAGGPVARALNGLNLNRGSALERKSRIANPQNASVRVREKSNACLGPWVSSIWGRGQKASVSPESTGNH